MTPRSAPRAAPPAQRATVRSRSRIRETGWTRGPADVVVARAVCRHGSAAYGRGRVAEADPAVVARSTDSPACAAAWRSEQGWSGPGRCARSSGRSNASTAESGGAWEAGRYRWEPNAMASGRAGSGRRRGRDRAPAGAGPSDLELGPAGATARRRTNAGYATGPNECCSSPARATGHRCGRDGRSGRSGRSRSCRGRELVAFTAAGRSTLTLLALLATGPAAQGHLGLGGLADRADDGDVAQQRVRECPTHVGEAIVKRFGRGAHRHTGQANGTIPEICPGARFCCGARRIRSGRDR